jgi:hypothetical protein
MRKVLMAAAAAATFALPSSALATVLYDSGDGLSPWSGLFHQDEAAARFIFGSAVTLTDIEGFINAVPGSPSGSIFRVNILSDIGDGEPGSVLFSTTVVGADPDPAASWQGAHGLSWSLAPGAYWVDFSGDPASDYIGVLWGDAPNPVERYAVNGHTGVGWQRQPDRDAAIRFSGEGGLPITAGEPWPATSGIPEPSAWALTILGFSAAGAALRRGRRAAAA